MAIEKKQPIGGVNSDDMERLLDASEYLNMENYRVGGAMGAKNGRGGNMKGTTSIFTHPEPGINVRIGGCRDESKRRFFAAYKNSLNNDSIICWDEVANTFYPIIFDRLYHLPGGFTYQTMISRLNFNLNKPVDMFFMNDCLYWTDGQQEPRMVNVERAIKLWTPTYDTEKVAYQLPFFRENISWIRKPPILPPTLTKQIKDTSGAGSGTGYQVTAKWYTINFEMGPGAWKDFYNGFILKVSTPNGDTWYAGPQVYTDTKFRRIDLYENHPTDININIPSPPLPLTIDFTTLPAGRAFSTIDELQKFYSMESYGTLYTVWTSGLREPEGTGPVTLINFPVPAALSTNNFIKYGAFQACWRYVYWDYEESVLSKNSLLADYNYENDLFDVIKMEMPLEEFIPQDVLKVDLCIRMIATTDANTGATAAGGNTSVSEDNYFIIKTWQNTVEADGSAILDHNNGVQRLTYYFDNSTLGTALAAAYAAKKQDLVPLTAATCAAGKNSAFMSNYKTGYNTPSSSSLEITTRREKNGVPRAEWLYMKYDNGTSTVWFLATVEGYYTTTADTSGLPGTVPLFVAYGTMTKVADSATQFAQYVYGNPLYPNQVGSIVYTETYSEITGAPPELTVNLKNTRILKTDASYTATIHFGDFAGRECGVYVPKTSLILHTRDRAYDEDEFETGINWTLRNGTAGQPGSSVDQIPDWAEWYSVDIKKCLRTRYFLAMRSKGASYVTRDADGKNLYTTTAYAYGCVGCAFDIQVLTAHGFGYAFSAGSKDQIKIWKASSSDIFNLKVIGTEGNWVITELADLGILNSTYEFLFEIYTPHQPTETEAFYECAQVFKVLNPGTASRAFSVMGGFIRGDVHLIERPGPSSSYLVEAMSPNDKYWNTWNTDAGKPIFIDRIGQVTLEVGICYSNKLLRETRTNGLSSFDALNLDNLFEESGPVTKLQLANKQEEDGSVLLAICQKGVVSIYLGETQLVSNNGDAFVAQAVGVIGTKNLLKGGNGSMHLSSVLEYLGNVWFMDVFNGAYCRYAVNGVFPVSTYKMNNHFRKYGQRYLEQGIDAIKALNGGAWDITSGIDPKNEEILVSLPATEDPSFSGQLPGFDVQPSYAASLENRYDTYDGKAKTWQFKTKDEQNRWVGGYNFIVEGFQYMGMNLYSFKNNQIWRHEADPANYNKFHGTNLPARIMGVANAAPNMVRVPLTASVEGTDAPTFTHVYAKLPQEESTDLAAKEFEKKEGIFYADLKNNRLSYNVAPGLTAVQKRIKGARMRAATPMVMMEWAIYDRQINIDYINLGYRESSGHKV